MCYLRFEIHPHIVTYCPIQYCKLPAKALRYCVGLFVFGLFSTKVKVWALMSSPEAPKRLIFNPYVMRTHRDQKNRPIICWGWVT